MSLLDIAKKRYSVRKYEDKPVEKEKLEKILACAHVAPTAANLQPVKLLVVQDKERLNSIAKAGNIYNDYLQSMKQVYVEIMQLPNQSLEFGNSSD